MDTRGVIRAGTAAQRPGHRGLPLRVLIAGLFVGLLAAAGVAGVGYGYVVTSRLLLSAGDEEFLHVAERTAGQVRDLLAPAQVRARGLFEPAMVARLVAEHLGGHRAHSDRLWTLMMTELWLRRYCNRHRS